MPVNIPVRHDSIKSNPPIRDTFDFLFLVISVGDSCNTGFNVLVSADMVKTLEEQKERKRETIELEDDFLNMIVQDLRRINFARLGIGGVNIAGYVNDIKKVLKDTAEKPIEKLKEEAK